MKVCFVLGQHRSGTSALAGSLSLIGGYLGASYEAETSRHNPRGYFENSRFVYFNDEILADVGLTWSSVRGNKFRYRPDSKYWHAKKLRLRELIREELSGMQTSGGTFLLVKDPRISILISLYQAALEGMADVAPVFIFCHRNVEANIRSLVKRGSLGTRHPRFGNRMNEEWASQLLEFYDSTFHADFSYEFPLEYHTFSNLSFSAVDYLQKLASALGLRTHVSDETIQRLRTFLDSSVMVNERNRAVKVIATYFGERRLFPSGDMETADLWTEILRLEKLIDPGDAQDVVVVLHDNSNEFAREFIRGLEHRPTRFGKIRVLVRPWEEGVGGSFKSFDFAFGALREEYRYWSFQEDNVLLIGPGYLKHGRRQMESSRATFVAYGRWDNHLPVIVGEQVFQGRRMLRIEQKLGRGVWHAGGGCGITTREVLEKIVEKFGSLPYSALEKPVIPFDPSNSEFAVWYRKFELDGEVRFTAVHYLIGGKIVDIKVPWALIRYPADGFQR